VYLVGDPIQLPATVISKRAVSFGYDVSLFKRLQQAGYPVQVLDTQYRMHPSICRFPSNQFYDGGVKTGEGVEAQTQRPWHADKVRLLYLIHLVCLAGVSVLITAGRALWYKGWELHPDFLSAVIWLGNVWV
jgi:superfamily I DNA and/or RNA helicase